MIQFDGSHIFQMGWFNHQLDEAGPEQGPQFLTLLISTWNLIADAWSQGTGVVIKNSFHLRSYPQVIKP